MARKKSNITEMNPRKRSSINEGAQLATSARNSLEKALASGQKIVSIEVENQMKEAYLDYAMSVIVGRALPDVRDGLKPVHRRILYAMNERSWRHDRPFVKSAKIVGEVIGNFHPHGDAAVYDTLVRMAQSFAMSAPLIDGQGNFGSIDGDPPAAYRYTEARLTPIAEALLRDIDKETVNFMPNFDDTRKEPLVLPASFPNLLVNGSSGIAVGMSTNIPPHNLNEVINASIALIKDPNLSLEQLIKYIPAPDFPTGGLIIGGEGLQSAYTTGRGSLRIRAQVEVEKNKRGREVLVITEIPYQVNKRAMLEKIGNLVQSRELSDIADIRDLSDRHGICIEIELKKGTNAQILLNQLYKRTQLQTSYGINFLALVGGQPRVLNLKEILQEYVKHRREIVVRRSQFELSRAEKRAHLLEGLQIALKDIDTVIKIIRSSKTVELARKKLIDRFELTEIQANAILDLRLQKLTSLEQQKILDELELLKKEIKELKAILKSGEKQYAIVSNELQEINRRYPEKRRTKVDYSNVDSAKFEAIDLISDEEVFITISEDNFIKRMARDTFRRQKRGGKGVRGGSRNSNIRRTISASTHDSLLLFSNKGKVFVMKVHEIPEANRESRGRSLKALINLAGEENISAMVAIRQFDTAKSVIMATRLGILKKSNLNVFAAARKGGIIALNLRKGDELIDVRPIESKENIILCGSMGNALRINAGRLRSQGRNAGGIIGMRLANHNYIVGMDVVAPGSSLLVISENGFGKRIAYSNFPVKGRGGKGIIYLKITTKNGPAVRVCSVRENDDALIIAQSGMAIRLAVKDIPLIGRSTVGVKIVDLQPEDLIKDVALLSDE